MLCTILKTRIVAQNGCEKIEDYLSLNNIPEDNETNEKVTIYNVAILKSGFSALATPSVSVDACNGPH